MSARPTRQQEIAAFVAALAFACIATMGLVEQRLDASSHIGMWIGAVAMACVAALFASARSALRASRPDLWTKIHAAHVLGATAGVVLVHAFLAVTWMPRDPELVECPAQLVNDVVLVGCVLALVWAVIARDRRTRLVWFVAALVPCFAYFRTPMYWHCDHFAGYPVQEYVASQLTAAFDAAVGLLAYLMVRV